MTGSVYLNDAINVDEVGIETGRYRHFLLKSAYQPVWLHKDGILQPTAVEGLIRPFVEGRPVPVSDLFDTVPPEDQFFVESLCRALHLRNHHNIGVPGQQLFVNYNPMVNDDLGRSMAQLHVMAERLVTIGLDIGLIVCEFTESSARDPRNLVRLSDEMRRLGMRVAIDDFGNGDSTIERVEMIRPDIIKLDGLWFRRVVAAPGAARLLGALVKGMHRMGASVLVEGIETPGQLLAAIEAGAERMQGYLLGRPALAGTIFDPAAQPVGRFLGHGGNIVPLARQSGRLA